MKRFLPVACAATLLAACSSDGSGPAPTATRLEFQTQPAAAVKDTANPDTIRVRVLDQSGALLTTATAAVTLSLGNNPGGATLGGTTTVNAAGGVARFGNVIVNNVGAGYTLVASAAGLTPDTSAAFTVTLSMNDADGDTYSPHEGDCNDGNPAIHPAATDLPDDLYVDTNCDGLDGERANAVFVAPSGADGSACGTDAAPCATIQAGIDRAALIAKRDVYIAAGTYNAASFRMEDGINVIGGYDAQWSRGAANIVTVNGRDDVAIDGGTQAITVIAESLTAPTLLADLRLVGANASGTIASGQGKSAYVVFVRGVAAGVLTIRRNDIRAGNGASGAAGGAGVDAEIVNATAAMNGGAGGPGQEQATCDDATRGTAGGAGSAPAGASPSTRSRTAGAGGRGGTMDTNCGISLNLNARPGEAGSNAGYSTASVGVGGAGGTGGSTCGLPGPGSSGVVTNGAGGVSGGSLGRLSGAFWAAHDGGSGATGENGSGGGGGGGAGGCDLGVDSYGAGGGGGGAGGLAARGGGAGGAGAGGSFGIYLVNASPRIENNILRRGNGGAGGAGGTGGRGQSAGIGGLGGASNTSDAPNGARGGDGAHGGHGGGGAGGSGGISFGIYRIGTSTPTVVSTTIQGGAFGTGGAGGASAPGAPIAERDGQSGQVGANGVVGAEATCAVPAGC